MVGPPQQEANITKAVFDDVANSTRLALPLLDAAQALLDRLEGRA